MIDNATIGDRIKACRQGQGLTLKSIEAKAGVSATHISEIERGKTSPTVGALSRIAEALGKNITYFLERETLADVSHQKRRDRVSLDDVATGSLVPLSRGVPGGRLSLAETRLDCGQALGSRHTREANHIFLVQEGQVRFIVDQTEHTLESGDSIHMGAGTPYQSQNVGDVPASLLVVSSQRLHLT